MDGNARQRAVGFDEVGPISKGGAPLGFCLVAIAQLIEGETELEMGYAIVGIVLQDRLQGVDGVIVLAAETLDLSLENLGALIIRLGLQELIVQLAGFVETVFQDQELNVICLDQQVPGMIVMERSVLLGGLVDLVRAPIEIAE